MNLHEYQGKQLFAEYGLPVSKGYACDTPDEAAAAADKIGGSEWVVKAQVHAGGRGKAGFVKVCKDAAEAEKAAAFMLSNRMVSPQTPPEGLEVRRLLVAAGVDPVHLGMVVVFNLMIGLLTPPMGLALFLVADIAKVSMKEVLREMGPYYVPLIGTLMLITYFPAITTWIPRMAMGGP